MDGTHIRVGTAAHSRYIRSKASSRREVFYTLLKYWSRISGIPVVFGGPGGFGEVRKVKRQNFNQCSSNRLRQVPSYESKTKKVHDYQHHDYQSWSVYEHAHV